MVLSFCSRRLLHISKRSFATFKNIDRFGTVRFNCPKISGIVRCVNPHDVPNGDMAFVDFIDHVTGDVIPDSNVKIEANYCKSGSVLDITQDVNQALDRNVTLLVQIPHNYNIDIVGDNVIVEETEGHTLKVHSNGDCVLGKIKSDIVDIRSTGLLICKNILGNGNVFSVGKSTFKKIQSKDMTISSSQGDIDISSCYCPNFTCSNTKGDIRIGSLHGSSEVRNESGDVCVQTLDGDLSVATDSGHIDVTIEKCGVVNAVTENGDVSIGLGEQVSAFIEGTGTHVDVPEDLLFDGMKSEFSNGMQSFEGKLGNAENSVTVKTTNGTVAFSRKNWFSKFNISLD